MKRILLWLFPVGRRSLLWGVHNFVWHPWTVYKAWRSMYGRPTWREAICILIHDWGYWSCPNMDGPEGERHPEAGAKIAGFLLGPAYYDLVLYHSRHYVKLQNDQRRAVMSAFPNLAQAVSDSQMVKPSKLCWADKMSILYDPPWFYLMRARLSGEIKEYRANAAKAGLVPIDAPDTVWLGRLHAYFLTLATRQDPTAIPYMNGAPAGAPEGSGK